MRGVIKGARQERGLSKKIGNKGGGAKIDTKDTMKLEKGKLNEKEWYRENGEGKEEKEKEVELSEEEEKQEEEQK